MPGQRPSAPTVAGACGSHRSMPIGGSPANVEIIELDTDGSKRTIGLVDLVLIRVGFNVVPVPPTAMAAMAGQIIVLRTLDPLAVTTQGTIEFPPIAGAQPTIPLEAILHPRYSPLTPNGSLGLTE